MALYNHLPVYRVSYDLLLEFFILTKKFAKDYRYTIGEQLRNEMIALIINIYRANSNQDKQKKIANARENIETVRMLARILKDLKQIGLERFVSINEKIESISKQLTAWQGLKNPAGQSCSVASAQASAPFPVQ